MLAPKKKKAMKAVSGRDNRIGNTFSHRTRNYEVNGRKYSIVKTFSNGTVWYQLWSVPAPMQEVPMVVNDGVQGRDNLQWGLDWNWERAERKALKTIEAYQKAQGII